MFKEKIDDEYINIEIVRKNKEKKQGKNLRKGKNKI